MNATEDLITFDDEEPKLKPEIGEASSSFAEMNLSPVKADNDNNNANLAVSSSPSTSSPTGGDSLLFTDQDYTFHIKDVTDYSKASAVDSIEISQSESSEGLLRGWSQDEYEGQDSSFLQDFENDDASGEQGENNKMNKEKALKALKKASVAVTGTALVVAGIPLIPMPTPGGVIVSGSGLALLATEFPAAQRVIDKGRNGLEKMVGEEGDEEDSEDDDHDNEQKESSRSNGYAKLGSQNDDKSSARDLTFHDDASLSSEGASLVSRGSVKPTPEQRIEEALKNAKATTKKTTKKTKKNLKKFVRGTILPLMSKMATDKEDGESVVSSASNGKRSKAKSPAAKQGNIADLPENFLSNTKLRSEKKKEKSPSKNLQGAFPVTFPDATGNLLDK